MRRPDPAAPALRVARAVLVGLLAAVAVGCADAGETPAESALRSIPMPASAVVTISADAPGVDDGQPFVAFDSPDAPDAAFAAYDTLLLADGFRRVGTRDGWHGYQDDALVLWVYVSPDGPPTSMLVRVGDRGSAAAPGSGIPGLVSPFPTGGATPGATGDSSTPEPATRPGGNPFGNPPGQGNGNGNGNDNGNGNGGGNGNGNGNGGNGNGGNGNGGNGNDNGNGNGNGNGNANGNANKASPTPKPGGKP